MPNGLSPFPTLKDDPDAEERRAAAILDELEHLNNPSCFRCRSPLCSHEYVLSVVTGFKTTPYCADCLACGLDKSLAGFLNDAFDYIRRQPCYRGGWEWASTNERQPFERPACLWPDKIASEEPETVLPTSDAPAAPDDIWDAGDMACGELVLKLRLRLKSIQPGRTLLLTASDSGAPADIPAWCNLTGHGLLKAEHPQYWIRRKSD